MGLSYLILITSSLFIYNKGGIHLVFLAYVDDFIINGNHFPTIVDFKSYLGKFFHLKDLKVLKYFTGVDVVKIPMVLFLVNANTHS